MQASLCSVAGNTDPSLGKSKLPDLASGPVSFKTITSAVQKDLLQ